ncbi:MAG: flagellar protein FliT [Burkholderiaceae bacterium]|nr:flagellar protein FliT [Burkholderiaceae bacterium]
MSHTTPLLHQYEIIASITGNMLEQARAEQWDAVMELGTQYHIAVEQLRRFAPLSTEDRQARRELLRKILDNDASIRRLAMPEIDRLGLLIGAMKRQQSVLQAYAPPQHQ